MSDISNQLIKNSYDYVLQSDLVTGIVYRIGGAIPVNPIFLSGLTINSGFTYSNGTEQNGYVLTCDASGNAYWGPASAVSTSALTYYVSATTPTGVTLNSGDRWFDTSTGDELVWINDGDSAQWVQICCGSGGGGGGGTDTYVTGLTINGNEIVLTQNRTDIYSAFTISLSGITGGTSGDYLPLSGGTVTGDTIFQSGLTATTISATTYLGIPEITISGGTGISTGGTYPNLTITNTLPDQVVTITGGTNIQINGSYPNFGVNFTGTTGGGDYLPLSGGTVTGGTIFQSGLTANTISATTYQNLPVSGVTGGTGISASTSGGLVTITNTAPDQTVTISSGTDISVTGTYPNFTVEYTGTAGNPGTTLIASNSCVIPADDITYYGATIGGWGFFNWDANVKGTISPSRVNLGIPLPENLRGGDTISVCGIAFSDATEPDSDNFDVRLDFFQCTNYSIIPLGDVSYLYGTDGAVCFNLYIELNRNLNACDTFLLLGFTSTASDATQIKISYSIKTPGTNR
jgi:hypothetical protein